MKKKLSAILCMALLVSCLSLSAYAATQETEAASVNPDDVVVTLTEVEDDGEINYITYTLEELSCTIYDIDNNVVYSGPVVVEDPITRGYSIKALDVYSESTTYWWPSNNENGFKCGNGIAVTVSIKTNSTASKTIGLTAGDSSKSTTKNPSAILYTGTSGYWKFYVKNHSSSDFRVTGGSLSWGE